MKAKPKRRVEKRGARGRPSQRALTPEAIYRAAEPARRRLVEGGWKGSPAPGTAPLAGGGFDLGEGC